MTAPIIDTRTPHSISPTFAQWANGNPHEMIKLGTYKKYRSHLKGFSDEQMATFDAEDLKVNGEDARSVKERNLAEKAAQNSEKRMRKVLKKKAAAKKKKEKSKK